MKKCKVIIVFLFRISFTFLIVSNCLALNDLNDSLYTKIKDAYLKSFNLSDKTEQKDKDAEKLEKDLFGISLPEVSDFNKKKIVYDIFSQNVKEIKSYLVINESVWKDLELFYGSGKDAGVHLFSKVDRTQTDIGRVCLSHILANPIADISILKQRQNAVKELVNNDELFSNINIQLTYLKSAEEQLLSFWQEDQFMKNLLFKKLYFNKLGLRALNDNPIALEVLRKLGIVQPILGTVEKLVLFSAARHFIWNFLNYEIKVRQNEYKLNELNFFGPKSARGFVKLSKDFKKTGNSRKLKLLKFGDSDIAECLTKLYKRGQDFMSSSAIGKGLVKFGGMDFNGISNEDEAEKKYWEEVFKTKNFLDNNKSRSSYFQQEFKDFLHDLVTLEDLKLLTGQIKGGGGSLLSFVGSDASSISEAAKNGLALGVSALCAWLLISEAKSITPKVVEEKEKMLLTNYIQQRLTHVASFLKALEEINKQIYSSEILKDGLFAHNGMRSLFGPFTRSKKLEKLLKLLSSNTFTGESSYFSFSGKVLAAYKLILEIQSELGAVLEAAGEVDAYMSIAKLYKEFQGQQVTYSFTNYENKENPYIYFDNFWNPFVNPKKVVTNDIELGGLGNPRNIILSGPNAGGKSTVLKGVTINILFGQTIGISPSSQSFLTPFTKIRTYLNITDDISAGNSLFKAEVKRAQALVNTIRTLGKGEFGFSIMDEMFSGTSPKEGEAASYAVTRYLSECKNSMCIIATHFPMLSALAEDTYGLFKNCKVSVQKNSDGTLLYPYKLEDGMSNQHIAFEILVSEGVLDHSILGMAQDLLMKRMPTLYPN